MGSSSLNVEHVLWQLGEQHQGCRTLNNPQLTLHTFTQYFRVSPCGPCGSLHLFGPPSPTGERERKKNPLDPSIYRLDFPPDPSIPYFMTRPSLPVPSILPLYSRSHFRLPSPLGPRHPSVLGLVICRVAPVCQ